MEIVIRGIKFRLLPRTQAIHRKLIQLGGACRYVWNWCLASQRTSDECYAQMGAAGEPCLRPAAPTFFTLGKAFTRLQRQVPWLQTLPFTVVRYTLKHQADAWQACFKGIRGYPQCHARRRGDRFTLPDNVKIKATTRGKQFRLYIPKIGWVILHWMCYGFNKALA